MSLDSPDDSDPFVHARARAGFARQGDRLQCDRYGRERPKPEARVPGRSTPTSRFPASAHAVARAVATELNGGRPATSVQAKGKLDLDSADVHAVAARGTEGSGGSLPFLDQIQRAFGRHDVSSVKAHVGGPATDAAQTMGARAYASGDRVAFAHDPDLFLAAHEAAHVVQQRGGVQLAGGVGAEGDAHEQHADAVASEVVRGGSAEQLLDQYTGAPSPGPHAQRDTSERSSPTTGVQMDRTETFSEEEAEPVHAAGEQELARHVETFVQQAPEWIALINQRTNEHTRGGQLTDIDPILTRVVANYRTARGIHESKVSAGEAVLASEMALASMVLGMLPGLGDVAGLMSAGTPFMREVEMLVPDGAIEAGAHGAVRGTVMERASLGVSRVERGPEAVASALRRPLDAVQGEAASRTTAPLTTAPTVDPAGEGGDAFALRAEQSKTAALRALLQCTQLGSNLGQVAHAAQSLPAALRGGSATPEQRELARSIGQLLGQWPAMLNSIMSLTHGVATARERMRLIRPVWSPAQLEVYLWLLWMSVVSDDDLLDADPVENRLQLLGIIGPGSITGVDFGSFTSPIDQAEAVQAARGHQRTILHALETYGAVRIGGPG
jgi:hypothetical protein